MFYIFISGAGYWNRVCTTVNTCINDLILYAMKYIYTLSLAVLLSTPALAQRTCATMDVLNRKIARNPALEQQLHTARTLGVQHEHLRNGAEDTLVIPVVFHVVWRTNEQKLSTAQVESQVRILNEDFQRRVNTRGHNTHLVGADCAIRFELARRDPNDQSTTGIVYTQTTRTSFLDDDLVKEPQYGAEGWPRDAYLNIWVCNLGSGLLGYASFPGEDAYYDGVVIDYASVGDIGVLSPPYNLGRTTTHEVGHWLGLYHTWGDDEFENDKCSGSDYIDDTPNQSIATSGCPKNIVISCNNGPAGNMYQNYMDYTDDACMNMFTQGQKNVMRLVLTSYRASLLSSNALDPVNNMGVAPAGSSARLRALPNPSDGLIRLDAGERTITGIKVYDMLGKEAGGFILNDLALDLSALRNGVYFIRVTTDAGMETIRVVLRK